MIKMFLNILVAILLVAQVAAARPKSDCERKRDEALGIKSPGDIARPMPGRFVPSCNKDGSYNSVQCHGSTGYCWCAEAVQGIEIPNTRVRFKTPNCPRVALTECQRKRAKAETEGLLGSQRFQCESDGSYKPVQRIGSVCYCVDDQGRKIANSETPVAKCGDLDCTTKFSKCQKERYDKLAQLRKVPLLGMFVPQCRGDGSYTDVQCHEMYCWCVNQETGESIPDTSKVMRDGVKPNCVIHQDTATECQKKYAQAMKLVNMGFLGVFVPKCKMNGDFEQIQCLGSINMCWCVEEKTGKALEGTYKIMTDSIQPNCAMTECQRQKKRAQELKSRRPPMLGVFEPECDGSGKFMKIQCHENSCSCVDTETGAKIGNPVARKDKNKLSC